MQKMMLTVLAFLGIATFASDKDGNKMLSEEQKAKMAKFLGEPFTASFADALSKDKEGIQADPKIEAELVNLLSKQLETITVAKAALDLRVSSLETEKTALETEKASNLQTIEAHKTAIEILS